MVTEMCESDKKPYDKMMRRRIGAVAAVFAALLLLALGRAWYIAIPGRGKYIAAGEEMARREVAIPAFRGSIIDADGVALAWSEHFYDLVSIAPARLPLTNEEVAELKKVIPGMDVAGKTLKRNLSPGEVMSLEELIRSGVRVRIIARNERIVIDSPEVRRRVGQVRSVSGTLRGVSGWEKEFDRELSGSPGRMSVMLDRNRNWIRSSVKVLTPMTEGRDIRVDYSLRNSKKGEKEIPDAK